MSWNRRYYRPGFRPRPRTDPPPPSPTPATPAESAPSGPADIAEIYGNTFPVREQLKQLGGRWNPVKKCWTVSADKEAEARRVVGEGPTAVVDESQQQRRRAPAQPRQAIDRQVPVFLPAQGCDQCATQGAFSIKTDRLGRQGVVCPKCFRVPEEQLCFN